MAKDTIVRSSSDDKVVRFFNKFSESTGVGFICTEKLDIGAVYEGYLTIWTKEVIHCFIEVVRIVKEEKVPTN